MLRTLLPESYSDADEPRTFGRPHERALGPVLRVLVWNILKARRRDFSDDFRALIADRDLVLLQEAVTNAPSDAMFAGSRRHEWLMARSFRDPRSGIEHGVKTGSVAPALDWRLYRSRHAEPLTQTQKLILATRYPLQGSEATLLVANMHAINFVSMKKYVDQLGQLVAALDAHDGPVLLAGDFNTWNPRRRASFFDVANDARLIEAPLERKSRLAHLNMHLDHVFYRGLVLRAAASLAHVASSDHAPITATFAWNEARAAE